MIARRLGSLTAFLAIAALAAPLAHATGPAPAPAKAKPTASASLRADATSTTCATLSPTATPCTLLGKFADAVASFCRMQNVPDAQCAVPFAHAVTQKARDAYVQSQTHRTAAFQRRLGDALPLGQAQWLGTHNSFNSLSQQFTPSHADSNQQLSLTQQLDVDIRSVELDLHYLARPAAPGGHEVVVCHGQGPDNLDAGCTDEPPFTEVLPQLASWLNAPAHQDDVLLLYLEDEMKAAPGYASAIATLDNVLRRPDGSSLIYRPNPATRAANGCSPLPLDVTRAQVRASGARVILVGSCAKGWAANVFDWNAVHVESGRTSAYKPFPACDATYSRATYAQKLVRYYEDSTLVATVIDPTKPPMNPEALTPARVAAMTACGVNLFGFDQLLPDDGRLAASVWSWADGQPRSTAAASACTVQGKDGRWRTGRCALPRRAACVTKASAWTVTPKPVTFSRARSACRALGATFAVPRSGLQNSQLQAAKPTPLAAWVAYRAKPGD